MSLQYKLDISVGIHIHWCHHHSRHIPRKEVVGAGTTRAGPSASQQEPVEQNGDVRPKEREGPSMWGGSLIKFFHKNPVYVPHLKLKAKTPERKWSKILTNRIEWSSQKYKASGRRMWSNRHSVNKIRPKQWTNVGLKLSVGHCPTEGLLKLNLQVG
jgi:hypothetical protein